MLFYIDSICLVQVNPFLKNLICKFCLYKMNKGVIPCSVPDVNYVMHSAIETSITAVQAVYSTYHGIVAELVHEVRRLFAFIVVEPHGALELIPGV